MTDVVAPTVATLGGQQLISWLPADEATADRLRVLTAPPRLRLVEPG